ncbi:MAG: ribbon-helix-helix domain-containing protein [Pseudomonadota bacterium]
MGPDADALDDAPLMAALSAKGRKRSVLIAGHATSITLEDPFWDALKSLARAKGVTLPRLIEDIDERRGTNLSSALRLYVLYHLEQRP